VPGRCLQATEFLYSAITFASPKAARQFQGIGGHPGLFIRIALNEQAFYVLECHGFLNFH
jgi:hypothetical protein